MKTKELNIINSLQKVWNQDLEMIQHCLKTSYYLELNDCFVSFKHKPSIDKTIYFDDERERPEVDKEYFIAHNLRYNFSGLDYDFEKELYLVLTYDKAPEMKALREIKHFEIENKRYKDIREITDEEKKIIKKLLDGFKQDYIKRLNTYWKRYSDKVSTHGYWANR